MHCMLMDLLHGIEVLSTTEETLFNSPNVSRLVQNILHDEFDLSNDIQFAESAGIRTQSLVGTRKWGV